MKQKIKKNFGDITEKDISKFEQDIDVKLPKDYKKFILKNNGGRPTLNIFETLGGEYESDIQFFFGITEEGIYDLRRNQTNLPNNLIGKFLPIAIDSGGNLILLQLDSNTVHFFDHEIEEIVTISNSFKEFLKDLYVLDEDESELDLAVYSQNTKYFESLINQGAIINSIVDEFDQPITIVAALSNKLKLLKFFIKNGADFEGALFSACSNGHVEIVNYLLKLGSNPNERNVEQNNDTALIQASFGGHIEIVKMLIENGADIHAKDNHDQTALTKAYWSDNPELIEYLEKDIYNI
nr:ankyrin repeat domain-containing protein [uncultured Psychroserpens sp.]